MIDTFADVIYELHDSRRQIFADVKKFELERLDGNAINFIPWKDVESQDKKCARFFYKQLNFSSQPQVAERRS